MLHVHFHCYLALFLLASLCWQASDIFGLLYFRYSYAGLPVRKVIHRLYLTHASASVTEESFINTVAFYYSFFYIFSYFSGFLLTYFYHFIFFQRLRSGSTSNLLGVINSKKLCLRSFLVLFVEKRQRSRIICVYVCLS